MDRLTGKVILISGEHADRAQPRLACRRAEERGSCLVRSLYQSRRVRQLVCIRLGNAAAFVRQDVHGEGLGHGGSDV